MLISFESSLSLSTDELVSSCLAMVGFAWLALNCLPSDEEEHSEADVDEAVDGEEISDKVEAFMFELI